MRIFFKNGMSRMITDETAEAIKERLSSGCSKFQTFCDENGEVFLIVNMEEVVYIS